MFNDLESSFILITTFLFYFIFFSVFFSFFLEWAEKTDEAQKQRTLTPRKDTCPSLCSVSCRVHAAHPPLKGHTLKVVVEEDRVIETRHHPLSLLQSVKITRPRHCHCLPRPRPRHFLPTARHPRKRLSPFQHLDLSMDSNPR